MKYIVNRLSDSWTFQCDMINLVDNGVWLLKVLNDENMYFIPYSNISTITEKRG